MLRRSSPLILLAAALGCGGAGQSTTTAMPMDPSARGAGTASTAGGEPVYKPAAGVNSPLGPLKALAPKSPLAKAAEGKADKDGAAKLAKLGKDALRLDDAYHYTVTDGTSAQAAVGDKGATVPLPAEAKANPDGSYWVVDGETRRVYTLKGVKREADKPATATEAPSGDLVRPTPDAPVPPLALAARAEEATVGVAHALRIVAKGVGGEGAPPEGALVRLRKGLSEKDVPLMARALVRGLKKYGAVLSGGEDGPALTALADPRWTKEDEKAVGAIKMSDFELIAPLVKSTKALKKSP